MFRLDSIVIPWLDCRRRGLTPGSAALSVSTKKPVAQRTGLQRDCNNLPPKACLTRFKSHRSANCPWPSLTLACTCSHYLREYAKQDTRHLSFSSRKRESRPTAETPTLSTTSNFLATLRHAALAGPATFHANRWHLPIAQYIHPIAVAISVNGDSASLLGKLHVTIEQV